MQCGSLWVVVWNPLFDDFSSPKCEKWPENGPFWPVGPIFAHFFMFFAVAEACTVRLTLSIGILLAVAHSAIYFIYSWVERQRSPSAHFVRRTVRRLVGLFIWFSAVLLWPIVLNVTVWSLFFSLSMWKVQCTCGSLLFICPTLKFTFGAPCAT